MINFHLKYKLRLMLLFSLIITIIFFEFNVNKLVISLLIYLVLMAFQCIGLHRYFSHNSFKVNKLYHSLFALMSIPIGQGSVFNWIANHRTHHKFSDHQGDPHSPQLINPIKVIFGLGDIVKINPLIIKDQINDQLLVFIHRYYFLLFMFYCFIAFLIFKVQGLIYFVLIPKLLLNLVTGLINYLCHDLGYRNYETPDNSKNNPLIFLLTLGGEGWHNNHHFNPQFYRHGLKWFEFDVYAVMINLIRMDKSNV